MKTCCNHIWCDEQSYRLVSPFHISNETESGYHSHLSYSPPFLPCFSRRVVPSSRNIQSIYHVSFPHHTLYRIYCLQIVVCTDCIIRNLRSPLWITTLSLVDVCMAMLSNLMTETETAENRQTLQELTIRNPVSLIYGVVDTARTVVHSQKNRSSYVQCYRLCITRSSRTVQTRRYESQRRWSRSVVGDRPSCYYLDI
jgi:hypothetical protein